MMGQTGAAQGAVHRNRLLDKADKYLFLAAFLFGAASIVILKMRGVRQFYVTAIPLGVMVVYGAYIIISPRFRLRDDRAGDSLYYLGFLFTMVSLAYSLYEFGTAEGGPRSIVTNFGIALATTITGLTLRVLYHQFRQDPFDVERQMQFELSEAADKLRGEIHETMIGFASLRLGIIQSLDETRTNVATAINSAAQEATTKYKSAMDEVSAAAGSAATKVSKSVAAVATTIDTSTQQVADSSTALSKAVGGLSNTVVEQNAALRERGQALVSSIDALVKQVKSVDIPSDLLKTPVKATLDHLDAEISSLLEKLGSEQTRVAAVLGIIEKNVGSSAALSNEITQLKNEAAAQRDAIRVAVSDLKKTFDMVGVTAALLVETEGKNLQEHKRILQQLQTDTAGVLNTVQSYRQKLMADVQESEEMLKQVHRSLVSLTRTIVEQVGGRRP